MNKTIIFGSSGLLGKEVFNYLKNKNNVIGVDIKIDNDKFEQNTIEFDITNLKTKFDFNEFMENIIDSDTKYISLIDCLLLRSYSGKDSLEECHNAILGYLTTSISLAKWFGFYCTKKNIKGTMVMMSSVKAFDSPKFYHYKDTEMSSALEYGVSKAGISLAIKDLSVRFHGLVRYNSIAPGGIEGEKHVKNFLEKYDESCLIKPGLIKPIEIAKLIDFLIRDKCPIIGQTIIMDNGWSLT